VVEEIGTIIIFIPLLDVKNDNLSLTSTLRPNNI